MFKNKNISIIIIAVIIVLLIGFGIVVATGGLGNFGIKPSIPSASGLIGAWSLAEADSISNVIYDKSGNGNNGTIANTPATFVTDQNGVLNQAMSFNGSIDKVSLSSNISGTLNSYSFWIKPTSLSGEENILMNSDSFSRIFLYTNGSLRLETDTNEQIFGSDANVIMANSWQHVVVVRNEDTCFFYVNAVNVGEATISGADSLTISSIGGYSSTRFFNGSLSDVAIYNKALSQEEISQLYKVGRTTAKMKIDARNLVTNGFFNSDTEWTKDTGWTISGGKAIASNITNYASIRQNVSNNSFVVGRTYKVIINISEYNSGKFSFYLAGSGSPAQAENDITSVGVHTFYKTLDTVVNQIVAVRGYPDVDGSIESFEVIDVTNKYSVSSLQKGLILDMPLADPYTKAKEDVILNGDFSAHTGNDFDSWAEAGGGTITHESDASYDDFCRIRKDTGTTYIYQAPSGLNAIKDKKYFISYDAKGSSGVSFKIQIGAGTGIYHGVTSSWTHYSLIQQATGGGGIYFINYGTNENLDITNIVVKPLDDIVLDRTPYGHNGTVNGSMLEYDGLINSSNGTSYVTQKEAYGTWEFDLDKNDTSNTSLIYFISDGSDISNTNGYSLSFDSDERVRLSKITNGTLNSLMHSKTSYIVVDTKYRIKIIRSLSGKFTVYIKGGSFGWHEWTLLISVYGSNPVVDNTYTISNYFVVDLDNGDKVRNLKINDKPIKLSNAIQNSGTWIITEPSYYFDGNNDYIDLGTTSIDTTGDNTLSFWMRPNHDSGLEVLLSMSSSTSDGYTIGIPSDGNHLAISSRSGSQKTISFNNNEWNHVVITKASTNINKVYLNGVEQTLGSTSSWSIINEFLLGTMNKSTSFVYTGYLGGVKMWNRELSADEIKLLYNKEKGRY